jgi:hypothetical protein
MGLVCGLIFYKIPHNLSGIRSAQSAFYLLNAVHSYLYILFEIYRLTQYDIPLFDRERGEHLVTGVAWVVSRRIAHGILEDFFVPFLFCFIFSYLAGFQGNIGVFLAVVVLIHYIVASFALFCCRVAEEFHVGNSGGELVCYAADLRVWFLRTSHDYSSICSMDKIYFLLCELSFFQIKSLDTYAYVLVLRIWRYSCQRVCRPLLRLPIW